MIKKLTCLPKTKAVVFGNRSFKPSNALLLTLIPWCPIISFPLPENCVIFSMFSGVSFQFFFQVSPIFLMILRCSWGNLSENVYVKILFLTLIEKFSKTCDFCLIIAARPVCWKYSFITDNVLFVCPFIHVHLSVVKVLNFLNYNYLLPNALLSFDRLLLPGWYQIFHGISLSCGDVQQSNGTRAPVQLYPVSRGLLLWHAGADHVYTDLFGRVSDVGHCPTGTYSNLTGLEYQSNCTLCPGGYFCDMQAQTTFTQICLAG